MTKQEIFDYLFENLRLTVDEKSYVDYGRASREIRINLYLKDPSGDEINLGGGYFSIGENS
jgi:hypothetical protein